MSWLRIIPSPVELPNNTVWIAHNHYWFPDQPDERYEVFGLRARGYVDIQEILAYNHTKENNDEQ